MESIGQRINRLRVAKGWNRRELGRRMAAALKRGKPFTGEAIRLYEAGANEPGNDARKALALVFERTEAYIEFGDTPQRSRAEQPAATYSLAQSAREEILLELYRGLTDDQQKRVVQGLRALFDANRIVMKQLGGKPLKGVSDAQVERAFGPVPPLRKRPRAPHRDPGTPLDDFLPEE